MQCPPHVREIQNLVDYRGVRGRGNNCNRKQVRNREETEMEKQGTAFSNPLHEQANCPFRQELESQQSSANKKE